MIGDMIMNLGIMCCGKTLLMLKEYEIQCKNGENVVLSNKKEGGDDKL